MFDDLKIIFWPDPRLQKVSKPIGAFDENLRALSRRMLELMREAGGVGLAAPQVGQNIRLFVVNATGNPEEDKVYVNPTLSNADGSEEGEEGCLSLPGLKVNILRSHDLRIDAFDLDGRPFTETAGGYLARIWQHEFDHLNGTLLLDRMGPVARLANRRLMNDLREDYEAIHGKPAAKGGDKTAAKSPRKNTPARTRQRAGGKRKH